MVDQFPDLPSHDIIQRDFYLIRLEGKLAVIRKIVGKRIVDMGRRTAWVRIRVANENVCGKFLMKFLSSVTKICLYRTEPDGPRGLLFSR